MAGGKRLYAVLPHMLRLPRCCAACDLWASVHGESPSKRIGVLQFQERLRERLTARDGSLYLLPERPDDQGAAHREQVTSPTFSAPQQQTDREEQGARHGNSNFLGYAAKAIENACRSVFVALGTLASVLSQPTQHSQQQQQQGAGTRKQHSGPTSRSPLSKLSSRMVIFVKVEDT